MKTPFRSHLIIGVVAMAGINCQAGKNDAPRTLSVRPAAVAGAFYPGSAEVLQKEVAGFLADAKTPPLSSLPHMLISPHAGYVFSGAVAACGYALIDKSCTTVFIIGPSHHDYFAGVAVSSVDYYETPLGRVPLDKEIIAKLRKSQGVVDNPAADLPEHDIEVQLPFLQAVLPSFSIIPVITGEVDPAAVAALLRPLLTEKSLVIASSDLSHYHSSAEAKRIDAGTVETILSGNARGFIDGCGERAIRTVMILAKEFGLAPMELCRKNSFEVAPEQGGPDRVVGYVSIAFVKDLKTSESTDLPPEFKAWLLRLARTGLDAQVKGEPVAEPREIPEKARQSSGCFVTLTKQGNLRGCIGYIEPIMPLYKAIIDCAGNAALRDPRFGPVKPPELAGITVEVSVLTIPEPLEYKDPQELLGKLVPGRDGIILEKGLAHSTFLPQVWEQLPDKIEFLEHLSLKGGMDKDGWKTAKIKRYFAIHFSE